MLEETDILEADFASTMGSTEVFSRNCGLGLCGVMPQELHETSSDSLEVSSISTNVSKELQHPLDHFASPVRSGQLHTLRQASYSLHSRSTVTFTSVLEPSQSFTFLHVRITRPQLGTFHVSHTLRILREVN